MSDANRYMNATYAVYNAMKHKYDVKPFYLKKKGNLFAKKEKVYAHIELMAAIDGAKLLYTDTMKNANLNNFNALYEFAEFVKLIENIFFYKNDTNACVVCDSKLTDNKKTVIIRNNDIMIAISLARVDERRKIVVMIKRNYGEEMENIYHIENGEYKDVNTQSDKMLLNHCSNIISRTIASFFAVIINSIGNNRLENITNQELFKTCIDIPSVFIKIDSIYELKALHHIALSELTWKTPEEIDNISKNKTIIYY